MEDKRKKKCFVVTPIGEENSEIRRHIDGIIDQAIIPAVAEKFEVSVAHRECEIGSINERVIKNIYNADLVIANLTMLNPNVMFELAMRYSYGKPAIVIAEKGTNLPFDITEENTLFYVNDPTGAADLKVNIRKFVEGIDYSKNNYGPIVTTLNRAAVIEKVEEEIKEPDLKQVFSILAKRLDNIEEQLNGMRSNKAIIEIDGDYRNLKNTEMYLEYYKYLVDLIKEKEKAKTKKLEG